MSKFSTILTLIPVVIRVEGVVLGDQGLVGPEGVVVIIHLRGTVCGTSLHLGCGRSF